MKRRVEHWSVEKLERERTRIAFPEYQREKSLWPVDKKCLLIDSILQDVDIPKLYFNQASDKSFEVVDGQQRLWSIWEFIDGEYKCSVEGNQVSFDELKLAQRQAIKEYEFQVTVFQGADDKYLRLLFVRLQLGLLLNTGEKLHAATGKMKHLVFSDLAEHKFIEALGIPTRRYAKQTLCAQICVNSFTRKKVGEFARTRYDDLISFFTEYADPRGSDLDLFKERTTKISQVLDLLWSCFREKTKELTNRSYILSIYLFVEQYPPSATELKQFSNFIFQLWKRLREESRSGMDRKNRELYSFQSLLSSAPGEEYQIRRRHEKLEGYYKYFRTKQKIKGD